MRDDQSVGRSVLCVAVLCARVTAAAADDDRAAQLFAEGRELLKAGNYAAACTRFSASLELRPAAGTKLNLADCEEHLGHAAIAYHLFREVAQEDAQNAERSKLARDRAAALMPKLAKVHVTVHDPSRAGLVIKIAGRAQPVAADVRDEVEPGRVDVVATAPDWTGFATTVTPGAGETVDVAVDEPEPQVHDTPLPPEEKEKRATVRRHAWVRAAWGLGIASAGAGAGALVVTLLARSAYRGALDRNECTRIDNALMCNAQGIIDVHNAGTLADVGTGLAIGAGVLLAAAAFAYVGAPRDRVVVAPVADRSMAGLAAAWSF
jgi:hypothetical protein